MKLLSVYIENYKNLSGTYDFTKQDGYIALIGENGSGKSNLLEAISLIYGKLYNISNIVNIGKFRICYNLDETDYTYGNIDEDNMLIPVFDRRIQQMVFIPISVIRSGVTPPATGFPYTFSFALG